MRQVMRSCKAVFGTVDQDVDIALRPSLHGFGTVTPGQAKAERAEKPRERSRMRLVDGEFDKSDIGDSGPQAQGRNGAVRFGVQQQQRAHAVDCDFLGRLCAELVVEDLERQRSLVAGRIDSLHEAGNGEVSLAWKTAEVTAPGEHIEVKLRRIRELNQENAIRRDCRDGVDGKAWRKRVETVEDDPDRWMIGAANDFPGVAVVVDVASPRQRLEADAQATSR